MRSRATVAVFALASFLGAFLVFAVQPLVVKLILPVLGGSPSVWNTASVFFQALLLGGYGYVHLTTKRLGVGRQTFVHIVVLLAPLVVLPIALPAHWDPPTTTSPVGWLIVLLAVMTGIPYFVVTTASPLLQRWFSFTGHRRANDPYFLYVTSNIGSLLALVCYPVLIEPNLGLTSQARWWTVGYAMFAAASLGAIIIVRRGPPAESIAAANSYDDQAPRIAWKTRARWLFWAFLPSSLTLGVTTHLSTDVAAVPLLWVVPLSIYLLTFILAFSRRNPLPPRLADPVVLVGVTALAVTVLVGTARLSILVVGLHLVVLFAVGMLCHGRLSSERPAPARLTEFFLIMSIGGVAGGSFNALVAPLIFDKIVELPLVVGLALLARVTTVVGVRWRIVLAALLPAVWFGVQALEAEWLMLCLAAVVAVVYCRTRALAAMAVGIMLFAGTFDDGPNVLYRERTFFGSLVVRDAGATRSLGHGTTLHGRQSTDPELAEQATSYYHPTGPVGAMFDKLDPSEIGVVGLGVGSMAAYTEAGDTLTFFEIDDAVRRIASDEQWFTYLSNAEGDVEVVLGDARRSLADAPAESFDLLAIDAFSSDSIPAHLLTREAVELYLSRVRPDGVVAIHISNQWLDLEGPVAAIVGELDVGAVVRRDSRVSEDQRVEGKTASSWIVVSSNDDTIEKFDSAGWDPVERDDDIAAWTDDFSNVFSIIRWRVR